MWLTKRAWLVGIAIAAAGCEAPTEIVPVAPPGLELQKMPPVAEGEGAQALGEQGAQIQAEEAAAKTKTRAAKEFNSPPTPIGQPATTPSGLTYETLQEGTGEAAKSGQTVTIHYTGTLPDGTVFDSSREKGQPLVTPIGISKVIAGWDEGVPGMKVGERRKLTIPPSIGYGSRPMGKIPPNSTLIFDLELLGVK